MYGRWEGELWFHRWHMWPVPSSSTPSVAAPSNSFVLIDTNSFSKDGRTIHVGDCALFKPSQNSLPFVGLIRKLKSGKENKLTLSVNWLYRPADVKLLEGASLEAAPNEIFYSFHKDEIPAASLLHPCKVAFLRKNLELPPGISSFVCRRVYDIDSKRLWWLTDRNYINKLQQEVDKLLDKTRVEMYGSVQTQTGGGRSPKPNGSQLKPTSDNVQNNSSSSISSHAKSKKRDHGSVHKSKVDDADSGQLRPDHIVIKTEISKISDKTGLMDFQGVEKLIQLMRPENTDKKLDLSSRTLLVDVISLTERFDYLTRFVQLRGLSVLDEWLQEIHKGKIGDGSPKDNDKSVEDFLFSLLRALDKLPVNLHALQTCNVGKSVNHLRSHKNSEIQKKARSLVSTWKRRVEAEMTMIETKSSTSRGGGGGGGSWPSKSMMSDVSHLGNNRRSSSTSQPSPLKSPQQQLKSGDPTAKSPPSPADKLAATGGGSPSSGTKSTTHSPNNSQSCSSDHGKTTGSVYNSRNSSNGFHGDKGSIGKIPIRSPAGHVSDVSVVDNGNNNNNHSTVPVPSDKQGEKVAVVEKVEKTEGCDDAKSAIPSDEKMYEPCYSSINALVESCAKFSEASVSVSPSAGGGNGNDDGGINLLATVAAGEISRSDVSPVCSPPLPEDSCSVNVAKLRRIEDTHGDSKDDVKTELVEEKSNLDDNDDKKKVKKVPEGSRVETQVNEESASWSSSDIHDDKKKVNLQQQQQKQEPEATTSCGEEGGDERKADSGTSEADGNRNHDSGVVNVSTPVKLDFDLNEDVPSDDPVDGGNHTSPVNGNRSPLITVAAPAKGPFYPSENLSRIPKPELGWKGSAATSAFRPAKPVRPLLDFDLNIGVDDSAPENVGGLDLDLNACQDLPETTPRAFASNPSSRGFDLNEEVTESVQFPKKGIQFLPTAVPNVRMNNNNNNVDVGVGVNLSSWFTVPQNNNAYPTAITIPTIQEQQQQQQQSYVPVPVPVAVNVNVNPSQRMLSPVLSSTPAAAVVPFQYSHFPFDTNFPFPPVSTAYVDTSPAGGPVPGSAPILFPTQGQLVSMPYRPSYFMSLPGGGGGGGGSSSGGKWGGGGGGLDLNSGPGGSGGGVPKRKEPEGGWEGDRLSYKHPSWQ